MLHYLTPLLQEIPDGVVDGISNISPYDATAYGGLVLVLLIFVYLQWKDKQKMAESLEKMTEVLRDIEVQLHPIQDLKLLIMSNLLNKPNNRDTES